MDCCGFCRSADPSHSIEENQASDADRDPVEGAGEGTDDDSRMRILSTFEHDDMAYRITAIHDHLIVHLLSVIFAEVESMKIVYSRDADVLTIRLGKGQLFDSTDMTDGIIVHISEAGRPLEIEVLDASRVIDKKDVEVSLEALFSAA